MKKRLLFSVTFLLVTAGFVQADPIPNGTEFQVNTYTLDQQDGATVTARPDGGFVVTWESYGQDGQVEGVFQQRLAGTGEFQGAEVQVNTATLNHQEDASVAFAPDGSYLVVWDSSGGQDGELRGIYGQLFDATGMTVGGEFLVNQTTVGDQNDAVVAAQPSGNFVVVWESDNPSAGVSEDLVGLILDPAGQAVGNEFNINAFSSGDQEDAAIGTDWLGNFVVAWESDYQDESADSIAARRFDAMGTAQGLDFVVNTYTLGPQSNPALAVDPDGSFVVVWEDYVQNPDDTIIGRYFDADGMPLTGEFEADSFANGYQIVPAVTLDSRGHAIITWQSWFQDGSFGGVYFNRFDRTGQPEMMSEMQVNTTTSGYQVAASVAKVDDKILIVWESDGGLDGSTDGVFGQLYDDQIFTDGLESGNVSVWSTAVE